MWEFYNSAASSISTQKRSSACPFLNRDLLTSFCRKWPASYLAGLGFLLTCTCNNFASVVTITKVWKLTQSASFWKRKAGDGSCCQWFCLHCATFSCSQGRSRSVDFFSTVQQVSLGHTRAQGTHHFWQRRLKNESQCRQKYYQAPIWVSIFTKNWSKKLCASPFATIFP